MALSVGEDSIVLVFSVASICMGKSDLAELGRWAARAMLNAVLMSPGYGLVVWR